MNQPEKAGKSKCGSFAHDCRQKPDAYRRETKSDQSSTRLTGPSTAFARRRREWVLRRLQFPCQHRGKKRLAAHRVTKLESWILLKTGYRGHGHNFKLGH